MDILSKKERSKRMSLIKGKNTKVEVDFRKYIRSKGIIGYRINSKLPGKPDVFFNRKKVALFIDGCFWHKCPVCFKKYPATNKKYWMDKINGNRSRDLKNKAMLSKMDIKVVRIWEHEIKRNIGKAFYKFYKIYENRRIY